MTDKKIASGDWYGDILAHITAGVMECGADGSIIAINPAALELLGVVDVELRGRNASDPIWRFVRADGTPMPPEEYPLSQVIATKTTVTDSVLGIRQSDGTNIVWVRASAVPVFSGHRSIERVIITLTNITRMKNVEASLRESEERYRTLAESSPEMIYLIDGEGVVQFVNAAAVARLGGDRESIVGAHLSKLYPADLAERHMQAVRGVMTSRRPFSAELIEQFPTGPCWIDARLSPVLDASGKVVGVLGLSEDITDRKRLEEELLRTQKIEALGVLAGGIAHDFNNLLGGVFGYLDLARTTLGPENPASEYLGKALIAFDRAKHLSGQLLTFSKGGEPIKQPLNLDRLLRECCEFSLSGANIRCEFSIGDTLAPVEADGHQISQVFSNLMINARQAMPEGGTLSFRADKRVVSDLPGAPLPPGEYIAVVVEDEGKGIPESVLDKIFDPFFTTKQQGSGLGLAISYSIVKRHGGHIDVRSTEGKGTAFTVWLPASDGVAPADSGNADETMVTGTGRILVMDDEQSLREMISSILETAGYCVVAVPDGEAAVAAFEAHRKSGTPFDIVILDLTVPGGMGGKQAFQELKKIDPDVLACVSSGYTTDAVLSDPGAHGFAAMITKPFRVADLLQTVNRIMLAK